jgi:transcriptional regulator with XRE-family HTH domain
VDAAGNVATMIDPGPAASRVLLGRELKDLREAAGIDQSEVAERVSWHMPKVYRSETGIGSLKASEIDQLLELYGASPDVAERVRVIAAQARRRGSFGKVPDWARQYVGLERDATELAFHQGELVPGLFQTEGYARALVSTSVVVSQADVDQVVESRMRRRELLERDNPPRIHLILGEAALYRPVGGREVLAGQLEYLAAVAELPHVTLQVLPFAVGENASIGTGFVLLTLDIGGSEARWVYLDDLTRGECRSDSAQVRAYQLTYDSLRVNAAGESETLRLIHEAIGRSRQ